MKTGHAVLASLAMLLAAGAQASAATTPFKGFVTYNTNEKLGWYSLKLDGVNEFIWSNSSIDEGTPILDGWMRNGRLCGLSSLLYEGRLYSYDYVELNEETGEVLLKQAINTSTYLDYYEKCAYDPQSDRIYGYGYSADGRSYVFKSSAHDFTDTQVIRTVESAERCASLTFNTETSELIGYNRKSFVRINTLTGEQTVLFTPTVANYQFSFTGIAYEPETGKYYWNYFTTDGRSHFCSIDLRSNKMESIRDYSNMTQFSFILPTDQGESPDAPVKPIYVSDTFANGALSGTVTFKLPTLYGNGNTLSGELSWTATLDGTEVKTGKASPGADVAVSFSNVAEGLHSFGMRVTNADGVMSGRGTWNAYIGNDTPMAPANVTLSGTTASWDAVTAGVNGGYVNPSDITYTVWLNGEKQGTTKSTSYQVSYPAGAQYASYQASVTAEFNGKTSEGGNSNIFKYGEALSLPVDLEPTLLESDLFSFSGGDWTYDDTSSGRENFTTPSGETIDSWLFMPPVATTNANVLYSVSVRAALVDALANDGYIEVYAGKTADPAAMTTKVMSPIVLSQTSLKEFTGMFALAGDLKDAGEVVIGFHAKSASGNYQAKGRRFMVSATETPATVAAAPEIQSVTAAPKAELKATVKVKLPSQRMDGTAIPASTTVKALIECDLYKQTVEGTPGSVRETEIQTLQGENFIIATSQTGDVKGNYDRARVYTGACVPENVTNLTTTIPADNQSCTISWDAPTEGIGEGYLDPGEISYYYCVYNSALGQYQPQKNLGKETSYKLDAPNASALTNINFAIQPRSSAGASTMLAGKRIQLGKPYTLPLIETFYNAKEDKNELHYSPYTLTTTGEYAGTSWVMGKPSELGTEYATTPDVALLCIGNESTQGYFEFPKFSTSDINTVKLTIDTFGGEYMPSISVWGNSTGQSEYVKVGDIANNTTGYHETTLDLPEQLLNQGWVSLFMLVDFDYPGYLVIRNFSITNGAGVELPVVENEVSILGGRGKVVITAAEETEATVSTLDGRIAWQGNVAAKAEISLAPGIYLVNTPRATAKVTVK